MSLHAIALRVEAIVGKNESDAYDQMLELAKRVNVPVVCKTNGVDVYAVPGVSKKHIQDQVRENQPKKNKEEEPCPTRNT